jgi:hypothetical protein
LLGANQGGRADGEITIGAEEVTDFAIGNPKTMFQFGSHREDDGAESIARRTDRIRNLLGMTTLAIVSAARTITGFNVELRDDRDDGRQIGLILDNDPWIDEVGLTVWAVAARDMEDAIDTFRGRCGAVRRCVALAPSRFLPAKLEVPAAKRSGLPMRFPAGLLKLLTEVTVLGFELGEAALQLGNLALKMSNGAVAFATAGAGREYHDNPPLLVP